MLLHVPDDGNRHRSGMFSSLPTRKNRRVAYHQIPRNARLEVLPEGVQMIPQDAIIVQPRRVSSSENVRSLPKPLKFRRLSPRVAEENQLTVNENGRRGGTESPLSIKEVSPNTQIYLLSPIDDGNKSDYDNLYSLLDREEETTDFPNLPSVTNSRGIYDNNIPSNIESPSIKVSNLHEEKGSNNAKNEYENIHDLDLSKIHKKSETIPPANNRDDSDGNLYRVVSKDRWEKLLELQKQYHEQINALCSDMQSGSEKESNSAKGNTQSLTREDSPSFGTSSPRGFYPTADMQNLPLKLNAPPAFSKPNFTKVHSVYIPPLSCDSDENISSLPSGNKSNMDPQSRNIERSKENKQSEEEKFLFAPPQSTPVSTSTQNIPPSSYSSSNVGETKKVSNRACSLRDYDNSGDSEAQKMKKGKEEFSPPRGENKNTLLHETDLDHFNHQPQAVFSPSEETILKSIDPSLMRRNRLLRNRVKGIQDENSLKSDKESAQVRNSDGYQYPEDKNIFSKTQSDVKLRQNNNGSNIHKNLSPDTQKVKEDEGDEENKKQKMVADESDPNFETEEEESKFTDDDLLKASSNNEEESENSQKYAISPGMLKFGVERYDPADDFGVGDFMLNSQSFVPAEEFRYSLIIEKQNDNE